MRVLLALILVCTAALGDEFKSAAEDTAITARVETMFLMNKHLNPLNIKTDTKDGVVTLTGSVNDEVQRDLARELAQSAKGVKQVKSDLIIVPTAVGEKDLRDWRQKIEDKSVSAAVRSLLLYNRQFKGIKIGVETVNNIVTLYGVVPTEIHKTEMARIARETKGVKGVVNNLIVRPKEAVSPKESIVRDFDDEWLETRVSTAIMMNRHVSIRELDVEVDDGVCILSGTVDTKEEQRLAAKIAQQTGGIRAIKNAIRIRAPKSIITPAPAPGKTTTPGAVTLEPVEVQDMPPESNPKVETKPLASPTE